MKYEKAWQACVVGAFSKGAFAETEKTRHNAREMMRAARHAGADLDAVKSCVLFKAWTEQSKNDFDPVESHLQLVQVMATCEALWEMEMVTL